MHRPGQRLGDGAGMGAPLAKVCELIRTGWGVAQVWVRHWSGSANSFAQAGGWRRYGCATGQGLRTHSHRLGGGAGMGAPLAKVCEVVRRDCLVGVPQGAARVRSEGAGRAPGQEGELTSMSAARTK